MRMLVDPNCSTSGLTFFDKARTKEQDDMHACAMCGAGLESEFHMVGKGV